MTTLQELIEILEATKKSTRISSKSFHPKRRKRKIIEQLLGKYKGVIPKGKTSTEYLRELSESLYGKIK